MVSDSTSDSTSDSAPDGAAGHPAATGPDGTGSPVSRARRVAGRARAVAPEPARRADADVTAAPDAAAPRPSPRASPGPRAASTAARPGTGAARKRGRPAGTRRTEVLESAGEPAEPGAAGEPDPPKAGRNLPAAIGVGLGLGVLIIATLFLWRPSFAIFAGLAVLYGCYEMSRAMASAGIRISLLPLLVGSAAMLVAAWERGPSGLVLAALVTVLGVLVWRLGDGAHGYARDVAVSSLVVLYLPMLAGFAILLAHPHDGAGRVIAFVATVVCSDTGGYAAGVFFGRHPLAPIVSKGKTWEGFAGSVIACSAAGILLMVYTFHHEWWKGLLFGLAVAVTATVGDLGESMIKRDLDLKDMGSLLPGHGGMMDRLDSLLPCAAVAYLILSGFAPV